MGITPANKMTKQKKEIKMSILDFFGPKIAEPKDFDKDLFIKYYVKYHLGVIGKEYTKESSDCDAGRFFVKAETGGRAFYFDGRLTDDWYWSDSDVETASRQELNNWLKSGAHVYIDDCTFIDFESNRSPYAKYFAKPLLYARFYPNKAISKQILSVLHAVETVSSKELQTIYDDIEKRFQEKQAKETEDKRQAALNVLLGEKKQR